MDYGFTDEQKEIVELTSKIAREKIVPVRAELDETEEFPWETWKHKHYAKPKESLVFGKVFKPAIEA